MATQQHLIEATLSDLRPTQMTVGLAEVAAKRAQWAALKRKDRDKLLSSHWFPAVIGPQKHPYIVDHHHLGVALLAEKATTVWVMPLADYSEVELPMFWRLLEFHQWAHPYDAKGRRQAYTAMPQKLSQLSDDPYRSLAGQVRKAGGYAKDTTPFAEFVWADFFRPLLTRKQLQLNDNGVIDPMVLTEALAMAHSTAARCLPGWSGRQSEAVTTPT